MSAQEMTPERLAEIRTMSADPDSGDNWCDRLDLLGDVAELLEHLDAITADRDEARAEVAALRAQRDEIREAHRVEVAALASDVAEVRDDLISVLAVLSACVVALKLPQETDGPAIVAAAQALTARLEAAERERDELRRRDGRSIEILQGVVARADAAEAKLAALDSVRVMTGDVYARPESNNLVESNTILVVTQAGDVNNDGTCRAQPYMRMPFDSWYSRHMLGKRLARDTYGEP